MPELLFWGKTLVLSWGRALVPVCSLVLGSSSAAEQSHRALISPHKSAQLSTSFPLLWTRLLSYLHPLFLHFLLCFSATSCHKKKNKNTTKLNHGGVKNRHGIPPLYVQLWVLGMLGPVWETLGDV